MTERTFACIDVETANSWFGSICQVGIALFEDGQLARSWSSLVNPNQPFDDRNIKVHGICESDVRSSPSISDVIDEMRDLLGPHTITAYGAFDRSALHQGLAAVNMPPVEGQWLNLHQVVRRAWPDRYAKSGYGLNAVCRHLSIDISGHHDALADAIAAGHVFVKAMEHTGIDILGWHRRILRRIPRIDTPISDEPVVNDDGPLQGDVIVFTGTLNIPRREAEHIAASMGCTPAKGVTKKTTILVVGDQDLSVVGPDGKSGKHAKAEHLISQGQNIKIIAESDFMAMAKIEDA